MEKSESLNDLFKALSATQAEIKPALKDGENPFFNSEYATLKSVWDTCREPLSKNGLSVIQLPCTLNGKPALRTILAHSSGQWLSEAIEINPSKADPQGIGSAITYFRRYGLSAAIGIHQEDDDGNKSSKSPSPPIVHVSSSPGDYVIKYGKKYGGKKIKEIAINELGNYIDWIFREKLHEKDQNAAELLINFDEYTQINKKTEDLDFEDIKT